MSTSDALQHNLPVVGAAVRNIIVFVAVSSIPLTAAQDMDLTFSETSSWIMALYGVPALLSLVLALRYRQPLLVTGNLFLIVFIHGLGGQIGYPELIGAAILAGAVVLVLGLFHLTERLAAWIPVQVVFGVLAGAVLPFVSDLFTALGDSTAVVGGALLAYVASRRLLGTRVPAILPALVVAFAVSAATGQFGLLDERLSLARPELTLPVFSWEAILTATPVFVVLIALQANLPSVRFLQSQDYDPPEVAVDVVSGVGTILASFLGPTGVSLSLPATSLVAGPGAGDREIRHRSVYLGGAAALVFGLLAGAAVTLARIVPSGLLVALAGLSLVKVLGDALERIAQGPLLLGPVFALAIALSDISLLGFGNFFWSLVIGTGTSLVLERQEMASVREEEQEG